MARGVMGILHPHGKIKISGGAAVTLVAKGRHPYNYGFLGHISPQYIKGFP